MSKENFSKGLQNFSLPKYCSIHNLSIYFGDDDDSVDTKNIANSNPWFCNYSPFCEKFLTVVCPKVPVLMPKIFEATVSVLFDFIPESKIFVSYIYVLCILLQSKNGMGI